MEVNTNENILEQVTSSEYKYGFYTDIENDLAPKGLNEDIVRLISTKKGRAGMDAGIQAESFSALADTQRTRMGTPSLSKN